MRPITFLKGFLASLLVASAIEAGRPKCSASSCASIKRDLISRFQREESPVEGTILHTRAELPKVEGNGIEAYVIAAVDKLSAGDKIYDDRSKSQGSTSLWRPFVRGNGNWASSFKTGLKFMTGCTAVVIVGPRGVYAAHFFEDIAMDPSIADKYAANLLDHGSKSFEPIKNHFNDLTGSPAPPAAGQQRDPFPQVFIMNPVRSREAPVESDPQKKAPVDTRPASDIGFRIGEREYDTAYSDIYAKIRALWPGINTIHEISYYALNKDNTKQNKKTPNILPDSQMLKKGVAGKILFEYGRSQDNGGEVRLFMENIKYLETRLV
jgi:hypothetical protein